MKTKTFHLFDAITGEYKGPYEAQESPLAPGSFISPTDSTDTGPPAEIQGKHRVFSAGSWAYVDIPVEPSSPAPTVGELKAAKNEKINQWRAVANSSTFPHAGKVFQCDALSRSDIDGVANHIGLFGTFPQGFPGIWKATDNSYLSMATIDDFKDFYQSMTTQGTGNFNKAEVLKTQLAAATTPEDVDAIVW
jgi:hypothetical protein